MTASCSINLVPLPGSTHHVKILNYGSARTKGEKNINLLTEFAFARRDLRGTTGMSFGSSEASSTVATVGVTIGDFFIGFRMASKMSLLPSKARMWRPVPRQAVMHALASNEIQMPYFHDLIP